MKKAKQLLLVMLMLTMFMCMAGCSDDEDSDGGKGSSDKEVTREDMIKDNKNIDILEKYIDEEDALLNHFVGIDAEGKVVEFSSTYWSLSDFYNGYAIAKVSGSEYHLVDKDLNVVFKAADLHRFSTYTEYIEFEDMESGKMGCITFDGKVLIEAKYDEIKICSLESIENTIYADYGHILLEGNSDAGTTDYYNNKGLMLFSGEKSSYYNAHNFESFGFGVLKDPEKDDSPLYSYTTGKKLDGIERMYGCVGDKEDSFVIFDKDFNVIKEIKYDEDKVVNNFETGKELVVFEYRKDGLFYSDIYSATTGEFLFTKEHDEITILIDKDGKEYIVYETYADEKTEVNIYNSKNEQLFKELTNDKFIDTYIINDYFFADNSDEKTNIYSISKGSKVSSVPYLYIYDEANKYVLFTEDYKKMAYINEDGNYYEYDVNIDFKEIIKLDEYLLYDYILLRDNEGNRFVIDGTTGKITFTIGADSCDALNLVPFIEKSNVIYDYNGKVVFDEKTYKTEE